MVGIFCFIGFGNGGSAFHNGFQPCLYKVGIVQSGLFNKDSLINLIQTKTDTETSL